MFSLHRFILDMSWFQTARTHYQTILQPLHGLTFEKVSSFNRPCSNGWALVLKFSCSGTTSLTNVAGLLECHLTSLFLARPLVMEVSFPAMGVSWNTSVISRVAARDVSWKHQTTACTVDRRTSRY